MRQFRQMSRPSFQLKPRQIIDQDDDNENEESSSKNSASTSFLDNSNYVNEEWYTITQPHTWLWLFLLLHKILFLLKTFMFHARVFRAILAFIAWNFNIVKYFFK